jgi:endonuclease/exonuclease/phosphatase family metal-dependent hydrolase
MTFTLASFNAHAGVRPRRNGTSVPFDLVGAIKNLDADVIVIQEAWWPDDAPSLFRVAAERAGVEMFELPFGRGTIDPWPHVRRDGTGQGEVGLAVLSRLPARVVGKLPFGRVFNDSTPERGGLHLEVDVPGGPIDVIGVHLTSRLPYGPPIQLRRLRALLPPARRPAIVAGDCNFWGPGVLTFLRGWQRAVRGRTWPAHVPHSQIDHILLRDGPSSGFEVVDAAVLPDCGSDHRPVRVTLEVR